MLPEPHQTPGRAYLTSDPTTPIDALHIAIIGDGKVHITTGQPDAPTLTAYDPADIDHIDLNAAAS
jgi:hypothetical protein